MLLHPVPIEMMDLHLTSQALGFGAGLVMSVMLLTLMHRGARKQKDLQARYYYAGTALLWNLGGLLGALLPVFGFSSPALYITAAILNFTGAAFFPPSFLRLWQKPHDSHTLQARLCALLCSSALVSAFILIVLYIRALVQADLTVISSVLYKNSLSQIVGIHVAITMALGAVLLLRGRLNNFVSRFYAMTTLVGAMAPATMILPMTWLELSPTMFFICCLIKNQAPLLVLLGAIVFFADFRYSNVYVKSSLQFLTTLVMALTFCLLLLGPLPGFVNQTARFPHAALIITATASLILFFRVFTWLNPRLSRLVDCRMFREPDYAAATRQLWQAMNNSDDTERNSAAETDRVFQTVTRFVSETLELEEVRVWPFPTMASAQLEATLNSGEVYELSFADPVKGQLGPDVEMLAPVRVKGSSTHVLAITPGKLRRHLLDSEITFLRAVAGLVSSRLEALQVEKEKADRQSKEERLRRQISEAELRALRAQINPHFLFNSLNTIADLIVTDPLNAERMTVKLSRVFRHVLRQSEQQLITIGEELDFLRTCLDIETMRFGERLQVEFDVDPAALSESIPSLILQPLVENALKHGLSRKVGRSTLTIRVQRFGESLRLAVEDDGPGFPPALVAAGTAPDELHKLLSLHSVNGNGVGLRNIRERLLTIYGGEARMLFHNLDQGGSRVTLTLPGRMRNIA